MRWGLIAESPEEAAWLESGQGHLLEVVTAMTWARSVLSAAELGVLQALRDEPIPVAVLAELLDLDPDGLQVLLDSLASGGLVARSEAGWFRHGRFDAASERLLQAAVDQWNELGGLTDRLTGRRRLDGHQEPKPAGYWSRYLAAMHEVAAPMAERLRLALPGWQGPVLDVGGGLGSWGRALAGETGAVTVLELPDAVAAIPNSEIADSERPNSEEVADLTVRAGDLRREDWGTDFGTVVLANVTPHLSVEERRAAFARARRAVRSDGRVVVVQPMFDGGSFDALRAVLFYGASGRRVPDHAVVVEELAAAGLALTDRIEDDGSVILVATPGDGP